jgi:hypothetical protein
MTNVDVIRIPIQVGKLADKNSGTYAYQNDKKSREFSTSQEWRDLFNAIGVTLIILIYFGTVIFSLCALIRYAIYKHHL